MVAIVVVVSKQGLHFNKKLIVAGAPALDQLVGENRPDDNDPLSDQDGAYNGLTLVLTSGPLVGEFAFQVKVPSRASVAAKPKKLAAQFYLALQKDVEDWLALGVTKTAMVYRLKGNAPQSHE